MERPRSHVLETANRRAFVGSLPAEWTDHSLADDYGVDLRVEIFDEVGDGHTRSSGLTYAVQLKATDGETARAMRVGVSWEHFAYWSSLGEPVLVVRYLAATGETFAMWAHEHGRDRGQDDMVPVWGLPRPI